MLMNRARRIPFLRKRAIIFVLLLGMVVSSSATTSSVKLAWDPNREADLVGYNVYITTVTPFIFPWSCQALSPIFVPLESLEDCDHPAFEFLGLENGTTYFFSVTAVNLIGVESGFSNTVTHTAQPCRNLLTGILGPREIPFEVGDVLIDHNWKRVEYADSYLDPVVIAGPPSSIDPSGVVVRIDRVTDAGFEICLQEWDYLDGVHPEEVTGYMVMEAGSYSLEDGKRIEAGHVDIGDPTDLQTVSFGQSFETIPVVVASVSSFNEEDAVSVRLSDINREGFSLQLQEQQANRMAHAVETVSYVAWEPSRGEFDGLTYTVNTVSGGISSEFRSVVFEPSFDGDPVLIGTVQTLDGADNVVLRWKEKTETDVYLRLAEEQSLDLETDHLKESVGFIVIGEKY